MPDAVKAAQLDGLLKVRMAGAAADGSSDVLDTRASAVVWVDHGDEVIFHVDSVRTALTAEGVLLVSLDLETDQTGRQTLVVPLALGADTKGGLAIACEAAPRGPELLVARWGEAALNAVLAALLDVAQTHARERTAEPASLHIADGALKFESQLARSQPTEKA